MGISKKKMRKSIKTTSEEFQDTIEQVNHAKNEKERQASVAKKMDNLFTENTNKDNLKEKR